MRWRLVRFVRAKGPAQVYRERTMSKPPVDNEIITHIHMPNGDLVELVEYKDYDRKPTPSYTPSDPGWKPLKEAPHEQHVPDE